ncbi:MAG: nuclear transport factor 2 family protein [Variibacter sp.]|nr:nuclear transport factor 2 family protein [Variibacter sp.]
MQPSSISVSALKHAIESGDALALTNFYADHAVMRIIDRDNPPSRPRALEGKTAIAGFYDDVCSRAMTHRLESGVADGNRLAFTERCAYPDGAQVYCAAMLELEDGRIVRQTTIQVWDS